MNAVVETRDDRQSTAVATVNPMQMLQTALDRGASIEQMQQLMDLQDRWEAKNARMEFVAAMAAFKQNPPEIIKDKHVSFGTTSYDHATLGKICAAVIQGLAAVDISHRWDIAQKDNLIRVTCVLTHAKGHSETVSMHSAPDKSGGKNDIQAIASAVTYLQRYTLLSATGLHAMDDDDGQGAETVPAGYFITEKQIYDLKALGNEVGADQTQFLRFMKVDALEKIPASQYAIAVAGLQSKRAK